MANSNNERDFGSAYAATKKELVRNVILIKYLDHITPQKSTDAKYIKKRIRGSLEHHRSSYAQKNHSMYCAIIGSKSVDYLLTAVNDMREIQRQIED